MQKYLPEIHYAGYDLTDFSNTQAKHFFIMSYRNFNNKLRFNDINIYDAEGI